MNQPEPLTEQQLDDITARANAATHGPWGFYDGDNYADVAADMQVTSPGSYNYREKVARLEDENYWDDSAHENHDEERAPEQMAANAAFIAHSREDVPALLAEVRRLRAESERHTEDLASADNPTHLRWGLNDVLWGDDDTVTVLLSGPDLEPYWLELEPDRAAVLREDLAGPGGEPLPAEDFTGTQPCGHDDYHDPHPWADRPGTWCPGHSHADDQAATEETS